MAMISLELKNSLSPPPLPSSEESGGRVAYNRGDGGWKRKGYDFKKVDRTEWKDEDQLQLVVVPRKNGADWDHDADDELYLERLMKEGYVMPGGETIAEEDSSIDNMYLERLYEKGEVFHRMPHGYCGETTSEEVRDC